MARKWIKKTGIRKHRGKLRHALGLPARGKKIPESMLRAHEHEGGHLGHMVREAITLRRISAHRKHRRRRAHHSRSR